jgi:hypothetical protein
LKNKGEDLRGFSAEIPDIQFVRGISTIQTSKVWILPQNIEWILFEFILLKIDT